MALRVVVNMAAHPALRPGLISAGALDALLPFLGVKASPHWASGSEAGSPPLSAGGSPRSPAAGAASPGLDGPGSAGVSGGLVAGGGSLLVAGVEDEGGSPHELALLALVRCMAISGVGGPAAQGALLSVPVLQVLLEAAAAPLPQLPSAAAVGGLVGMAGSAGSGGGVRGLQVMAPAAGEGTSGASLPPSVAVVVEATEVRHVERCKHGLLLGCSPCLGVWRCGFKRLYVMPHLHRTSGAAAPSANAPKPCVLSALRCYFR